MATYVTAVQLSQNASNVNNPLTGCVSIIASCGLAGVRVGVRVGVRARAT